MIIPHAVGSDIGCGMIFAQTNIKAEDLKNIETGSGSLLHNIIGSIQRNIPVGGVHHKQMQPSIVLTKALNEMDKYIKAPTLIPQIEEGFYQIGTLGGGNHFIELQEDEEKLVCIMIHSGSRHFGKQVGDYFDNIARELNKKWYSMVPESFMSCSHGAGRSYSRTKAKELYSVEKVMCDLKEKNIILGKSNKQDVAEECRFAYKDIDTVINNQLDLITPIKKLKTIGVVKG